MTWKGASIYLVLSASSPSSSRVTKEIERTLRRGASTPRTKHNKGKIEGQKLKIQELRNTLNAPSAPLDGLGGTIPVDVHDTATASTSENGAPSILPPLILYSVPIIPVFSTLIHSSSRTFDQTRARTPLPDRGDLLESG